LKEKERSEKKIIIAKISEANENQFATKKKHLFGEI
jgi:hypothetical protein